MARAALALSLVLATRSAVAEEELAPPPPPSAEDLAPPPSSPDEGLAPLPDKTPAKPADWSAWAGVTELRGYHTMVRTFDQSKDNGVRREVGQHIMEAEIKFRFVRKEKNSSTDRSFDVAEAAIAGRDEAHHTAKDWAYDFVSSVTGNFAGPVKDLSFTYSLRTGKWQFSTGGELPAPYVLTTAMKTHALKDGQWRDESETQTRPSTTYAHAILSALLPTAKPSLITGRNVVSTVTKSTSSTDEIRSLVYLAPVYEDAEVEVEIEGTGRNGQRGSYAQWIPAGTLNGKPGALLKVTARLKMPNGKKPSFTVKEFRFRLNDTSREPGYCLNFPLNAKSAGGKRAAPDLRFAKDGGENDPELQEKRLPATIGEDGLPTGIAQVECFDWGAWSDLTVTATLDDGREVTGHLKGDPSAIVMPLPKHGPDSHIADAWKQQHQAAAGDDSQDDEEVPCNGRKYGDGFTLYEEYRGFAEDGRHIEGDPAKIDFFVRNEIGANARDGIELFANLTGFAVHDRLKANEFFLFKRVMNANRAEGTHRVDQHAVVLAVGDHILGGMTYAIEGSKGGRPGLTKGILIQPRSEIESALQFTALNAQSRFTAFDVYVAHELLHSVGVDHHGNGAQKEIFTLRRHGSTVNTTGRTVFTNWRGGREQIARIIAENTNEDIVREFDDEVDERTRQYEERRARELQYLIKMGYAPTQAGEQLAKMTVGDYLLEQTFTEGVPGDEHSGDDQCVMRYYFARIYKAKGRDDLYYFVKPATENLGLKLCHSKAGLGCNAPGHQPQSRYGDAQHGDCASQVCPNDAIPK